MLMRVPESLNKDFSAITSKMDADWNNNQTAWVQHWAQGARAVRAEAGDPTMMNQFNINISGNRQNNFYFNRIRPICGMLSGVQRRNRKSIIVNPLENGDSETADQWTKIMLQWFKKENVHETISEAFHQGAVITGLNFIQLYLDFSNDPLNGEIKAKNLDYNEVMCDPFFREPDYSDGQFIWRRTFLTPSACAAICPPDMWEKIMSLQGSPSGMSKDARFQYMPESFGTTQGNKLTYDEYWYRDYRQATLVFDSVTGDMRDVTYDTDIDLDAAVADNPQLTVHKKMVPTVRLALRVQNIVIYDGPNPLSIDNFPFIPVIGYYSKSLPYMYQRIAGVVQSLIDPQILFNRRVILSADMIEAQVTGGWKFKEGAVIDVKHLFQTGAGRVIPIKDGYQMSDVEQIAPPTIPPSFFELQQVFDKELYNCAGISEENLGKIVQDDSSGYLAAQRTAAGLTATQPLFDRLDLSTCMLGNRFMEICRANYTPAKIKNILEGEEPAQLFYDKAFGKYHSQVQLSYNTESQQQLQFAQLLTLRKDAGVAIPDEDMIEASTIQHKDRMLARMQEREQAAQQQQQQLSESQMKLNQAQSELAQARAMADMGLYNERTSRVQENFALAEERRAESVQNENQALLNFVRAAKELEGVDLAHLRQLLDMQTIIKGQEAENSLEEKSSAKEPTPEEKLKESSTNDLANLQGQNQPNMVENAQVAPQAAPEQAINPLQ
jgi:hypothetical protein